MRAIVDRHRFADAGFVFVALRDFPAIVEFAQGKIVRTISVDFVRGCKNEHSVWRALARAFEYVQRTARVHAEVYEWRARGPVVRRLRGGVDDQRDVAAILFEDESHRGD